MSWHVGVLIGFFALFAISARAQISYEGQPVNSVDLVTDPHVDVGPLRALVEQAAHQPYSDEKVQATVANLQKTGKFTSVELQATPEPAGLRLAFVMEPAYYIGVLQFPGAVKVFSYTRLLQVVNMPDEDAFDQDRLADTRGSLLRFLQNNGFFQAKVASSVQLDDVHKLANVIFSVELGHRARIGRVELQGPSAQESAQLLRTVRSIKATFTGASLKSGKVYTPDRVKAATRLLQSYLAKHQRLENRVSMNPPEYHADTNRVDLAFKVDLGPKVSVRVTGARLSLIPFASARQKKKLLPVLDEGMLDQDLVEEGRRNLSNYFQEKGFFDVKVTTDFQRQPELISITYKVDKGKAHKVDDISFSGNSALSDSQLLPVLTIKKGRFFGHGRFSQKLLTASVHNIEGSYVDNGYEDVKVEPQVVDHENTIDVTFKIVEGIQTKVDAVHIEGNAALTLDQLKPRKGFNLASGGPFSPRRLDQDRNRILARYLDRGYLNAEVNPKLNRHSDDPHKIDVTLSISEHQQVRISQVVTMGQSHTQQSLISKTANVWPETPLSQGKLLQAESELYNLQIFDWSSVGPRKPITTQSEEEALIKVHEAKRNSITYGVGLEISRRGGNVPSGTIAVPGLPTVGLNGVQIAPSENTFVSPRGSVEYTRRNLRGRAETASISLLVSRLDQRALATYSDPHFRGSQNWSSLLSLSAERTTENPLFAARLGDGSLQFERPLDKKKTSRLQLRYDFHKTVLSELLVPALVLPADRNVRISMLGGTFIRDTRDKPLDAHRGVYQTLDLGITSTALGASADFARMLGQYATYRPVRSMVWANSVRLGLAKPFSGSDVPTSERFFSGGGTTLRGFPINEAGPQRIVPFCSNPNVPSTCTNITVPVGGNQLFVFNSELRFPLRVIDNLGGVFFYDGGNVYSAINFRQFADGYSNTVGVGLRYNTPIGPVRIDVGRNLNPVTGINATQFFITLGQAF